MKREMYAIYDDTGTILLSTLRDTASELDSYDMLLKEYGWSIHKVCVEIYSIQKIKKP